VVSNGSRFSIISSARTPLGWNVNQVVTWLANLTRDNTLPQKLLVLHQFQVRMIVDREWLDTSRDELAIQVHVDGQGTQPMNQDAWQVLHQNAPADQLGPEELLRRGLTDADPRLDHRRGPARPAAGQLPVAVRGPTIRHQPVCSARSRDRRSSASHITALPRASPHGGAALAAQGKPRAPPARQRPRASARHIRSGQTIKARGDRPVNKVTCAGASALRAPARAIALIGRS
jgi:hypothetical protein